MTGLPHLLGCLTRAVELLDRTGHDVDARVIEAHRAELVAGREWPGDPIPDYVDRVPPVFADERERAERVERRRRDVHGQRAE